MVTSGFTVRGALRFRADTGIFHHLETKKEVRTNTAEVLRGKKELDEI
jgi:hypothetical protein